MNRTSLWVSLALALPGFAVAETPTLSPNDADVETLVVQGSRAIAAGYDARGTQLQRVEVAAEDVQPAAMVEWLTKLPGVAENGQGGWVQMYSLRGVSRQRVLTFVAGIPIITDRRAGTAAHFVDPALIGEATVLTGPASSIYGLGALGGIVQFFPRQLEGATAGLQVDDNGDGRGGFVGWGDSDTTLMLAGLSRDDSEAADGTVINDHGDRWSALLRQRWALADGELEVVALPAVMRDIGRANANFYIGRVTETPEEDHWPMRVSYRANSGWEAAWFVHDHVVSNVTDRIGVSVTTVDNEATDTGASVQWPWQGSAWRGRLGVDWLGRLNVDAKETAYTLANDTTIVHQALDAGEEHQLSVFSEMETQAMGGELQFGLRLTAQEQSAHGESNSDDNAYAAHLGWERLFDDRWFVFSSIGSAVRFPALTERFYNGTTGRGTLIGNAELEPETALSFDLGVRTRIAGAVITAQYYRQSVDDYIEQIVVQPNPQINSYINLDKGTLKGAELAASWPVTDSLTVTASAHRVRGESEDGEPLADIPADRWQLGLSQHWQQCQANVAWTWRKTKTEVGPDEIELESADYGEASVSCDLSQQWRAAFVVSNAGDELYLANADSQAALMPGRRISLRLSWHSW